MLSIPFFVLYLGVVSITAFVDKQQVLSPHVIHDNKSPHAFLPHHTSNVLSQWLDTQIPISLQKILENVSPDGTSPGCVVASPSRHDPDYWYHWVRDSALTMSLLVRIYSYENLDMMNLMQVNDTMLETLVWDYAKFSRKNQVTENRSGGLGEPKFHVDGSAFNGDWGRPQNDGSALRASTLIKFAERYLMRNGSLELVHELLYSPSLPANSVIKADLEYIAHTWESTSFELWEEVSAVSHFYTLSVQLAALRLGSEFASFMNDPYASTYYSYIADSIQSALWLRHYKPPYTQIDASFNVNGGFLKKRSNLDVSTTLAAIHGHNIYPNPDILCSNATLKTALLLLRRMKALYPVNSITVDPVHGTQLAPAVGRYTEDEYDGIKGASIGNPWVLTTASYAELTYTCTSIWKRERLSETAKWFADELTEIIYGRNNIEVDDNLIKQLVRCGDAFLNRVRYHANADGSLSEQINRVKGDMRGARDLTWSHASVLTAAMRRSEVVQEI